MKFEPFEKGDSLDDLLKVIRTSFFTVAHSMGFTPENAPTNPAFLSLERLEAHIDGGAQYFVAREKGSIIGCVAVEESPDSRDCFYVERLAVLPEHRHNGVGKRLMYTALNQISSKGAAKASIGIINENTVLKEWYINLGFSVNGIKKFDHLPFTVCFLETRVDG